MLTRSQVAANLADHHYVQFEHYEDRAFHYDSSEVTVSETVSHPAPHFADEQMRWLNGGIPAENIERKVVE